MSNFLATARADLKALLEADYRVHEYRPEGLIAPCLVIEAADSGYVTPGRTASEWTVNLSITAFIDSGVNRAVIERGDAVVTDVVERLRGHWNVSSVDTGFLEVGESYFYAVILNIDTTI